MADEIMVEQELKQTRYERYVEEIAEDITNTVQEFGVQPILFVGSGLTKRYMDGPSWEELLGHLADKCSTIEKGLGFYKQSLGHYIDIGQEFSRLYQDWAWSAGHNEFPKEMFEADINKHSYIKYKIAEFFKSIKPGSVDELKADYQPEIEALAKIKPHAIITTNYDEMLEMIFPDHERIIGQQLLKGQQVCIGELYKIHGCVSMDEQWEFLHGEYIGGSHDQEVWP